MLGDCDFAFYGLLAVDGVDKNIGRALFDGFDCAVCGDCGDCFVGGFPGHLLVCGVCGGDGCAELRGLAFAQDEGVFVEVHRLDGLDDGDFTGWDYCGISFCCNYCDAWGFCS